MSMLFPVKLIPILYTYICAIHIFRKVFPMDILGLHLSDDIEALLYIYCQHQAELKPGNIIHLYLLVLIHIRQTRTYLYYLLIIPYMYIQSP